MALMFADRAQSIAEVDYFRRLMRDRLSYATGIPTLPRLIREAVVGLGANAFSRCTLPLAATFNLT